jgi:hypothetical protein
MATIYYDLETIGGLIAAGSIQAEDGYIESFELPDGTTVSVDRAGFISTKPSHFGVAKLVWKAIQASYAIKLDVEATRSPERLDSAPIRINPRVG